MLDRNCLGVSSNDYKNYQSIHSSNQKVFIGSMLVLTALLISACADDSNSDNEVAITVTVGSSS